MGNKSLKIYWNSIVFVRLTLFLIAGILSYIYLPDKLPSAANILFGLCVIYLLAIRFSSKRIKRIYKSLFGLIAFSIVFLFGYCLTELRTATTQTNHLIHFQQIAYYKGQIVSDIQVKAKSRKFTFNIQAVYTDSSWQEATGQVLLYLSNTDSSYHPHYGDQLLIKGAPQQLNPPNNPAEFDYKRYLSFHNIYHQQFLRPGQYHFIKHHHPSSLIAFSLQLRNAADAIFRKYLHSDQAYSIATALILGVKDHLDSSIKQAYSSAGAMHVLAVSGLHVGIIFKLITWLLGRLKNRKWGNLLFVCMSIASLWLYALITGLSPSVLRAVTMFSFLIIASSINRQVNIYNTLSLSAFVLLCWNPYLIMGVGFLLSYAAVIGIVYLQPKLARLLFIRNRFLRFLWEITCVSIAAQLATFPIGLLFFHQFPTYFLISNFFVIPAATLILQLGLGLLLVGSINDWLAQQIGCLLNQLIEWLNFIIFAIQDLPNALIQGIHIDVFETWLIYLTIIGILLTFAVHYIRFMYFTVLLFSLFSFLQYQAHFQQHAQKALAVYHINKQPNLCLINGKHAVFLADTGLISQENKLNFHVKHHLWELGIREHTWLTWSDIHEAVRVTAKNIGGNQLIVWENQRIFYYTKPVEKLNLEVDYLILGKNVIKQWKDLPTIHAKTIILDASYSTFWIKKLLASKNEQLNIHSGHFIQFLD